ncbi:MAG: Rrf2 family transcriptional regulator [Thermodesulfobacteriota bacterium]
MRLSTKSLYGVRAVFDIAYNSEGLPVQIRDISKRQRISPRYLEQIFQKLKKAGVLRSKRGPHGGYYLAKRLEEITVGDILRATEGPPDLVFCVTTEKAGRRCDLIERCVTRPIWEETGRRITEFLDSISLYDLCKKGEEMGV